jgi:hypothetical protein
VKHGYVIYISNSRSDENILISLHGAPVHRLTRPKTHSTPTLEMPRATTPKDKSRHDPLHVQIGEDETYAKFGRVNTGKRGKKRKSENHEEVEVSGLMRSESI